MLVPIRDMRLSSQDGPHVCVLFSLQLNCQLRSQRLVSWLAWGLMQEVLLKRDGIKIKISLGTVILLALLPLTVLMIYFVFITDICISGSSFLNKCTCIKNKNYNLSSTLHSFAPSHYVSQTKSKQREQSNTIREAGDHRVDRNKKWKSQNHSKAEKKKCKDA